MARLRRLNVFLLYGMLFICLMLLFTGCARTAEDRKRETAMLDAYLAKPPFQCAIDIGSPGLQKVSYDVAVLSRHYHGQLGYFRKTVEHHKRFHAYLSNIEQCMEECQKSREEAIKIVQEKMQAYDAEQPEESREFPKLMEALDVFSHVNEDTLCQEVETFNKPFGAGRRLTSSVVNLLGSLAGAGHIDINAVIAAAQGERVYFFYSDILQELKLVALEECRELDKALDTLFGQSSFTAGNPRLVEMLRRHLCFSPETIQERVSAVNPDEVQGALCFESMRMLKEAQQITKEARYEETKIDDNGKEYKVIRYRQRLVPRHLLLDLTALYVIETQLQCINKTATYIQKIEKSKSEADKSIDQL